MSLRRDTRQMPAQSVGLATGDRGEAPRYRRSGGTRMAAHGNASSGTGDLMEEVVARENVLAAIERVRANKGSPGIDGMTVDELWAHLVSNGQEIRSRLMDGTYKPSAVRRVDIPKPDGGVRTLGIPTVVDRFVQQCILQILQPRFDPTFSESSYGFRPGRRAHGAILAVQRFIDSGKTWVVDVDLEKFFDRVNHDILMGRLAKRIEDKRMLAIIRRFLSAGMMADGVVVGREEGTPQGGPLSPLLANVLLDEVDKNLERRGHSFARYADDLNVYVGSKRAADDVMQLLRQLFAGLRLKVNEGKSAVARPWGRKFLGFSFWGDPRTKKAKRTLARKTVEKLKETVRKKTARSSGRSVEDVVYDLGQYLRGWKGYFQIVQARSVLEDIDSWIRRRLRALTLSRWKRGVRTFPELRRLGAGGGVAARIARRTRSWWGTSLGEINQVLDLAYFDRLGLPRLA
jgi:RNA-directed DNA polymerase